MPRHLLIALGLMTVLTAGCGADDPAPSAGSGSAGTLSAAPSPTASTASPSPSPSAPLAEPRTLAFEALKPGMCIVVPEEAGAEEGADEVEVVDCRANHDAEVMLRGRIDLPDAWPSDQALDEHLSPRCEKAFASYVGIPYEDSRLEYDFFSPVRAAWEDGDRGFNCVVFDPDASVLTQTYKGSRQ
jgi:hypothetical protein